MALLVFLLTLEDPGITDFGYQVIGESVTQRSMVPGRS